MKLKFILLPSAIAIVLAACGGGSDSASPEPIATSGHRATLVAGISDPTRYASTDMEPGCVDGAALGAKLYVDAITQAANGDLLLAETCLATAQMRIRAIDLAGNTIRTLATGGVYAPFPLTGPLTTFVTPTSLAAMPSGEIAIADSFVFTGGLPPYGREAAGLGPGVWLLGAGGDGNLLAGVALGQTQTIGVDGQGTGASFSYLSNMCHGSDGLLYVNDSSRARTIGSDGTVRTYAGDAKQHMVLACGPAGSVLMYRLFDDPANDDYYDPIARKSIAKGVIARQALSSEGYWVSPLAYFGPENPSVVVLNRTSRELTLLNLTDGSTATIAKLADTAANVDLAATPPVIGGELRGGIANNGTDFTLVAGNGVIQFKR